MQMQRYPDWNIEEQFSLLLSNPGPRKHNNYRRIFNDAVLVGGKEKIFHAHHEDLFGGNQANVLSELCNFLGIEVYEMREETLKDNRRVYEPISKAKRKAAFKKPQPMYEWALTEFDQIPRTWKADMEEFS